MSSERESRQSGSGEGGSGHLGGKEQTGSGGRTRSGNSQDQGGAPGQQTWMDPGVEYPVSTTKKLHFP